MTTKELKKFREKFIEDANSLSDKKSIEYTISNDDRLFNFKNVGNRVGITPEQALMTYVLKHMDAICNDAKTGEVVSDETILSRAHDVVNYMILYAALKTELSNNIEDKEPHTHDKNNVKQSGTTIGDSVRIRTSYTEPPKWEGLP